MTNREFVQSVAEGRRFLRDHWQTPEDYVTGKFAGHDVVLLAEEHAIRHNLLLVKRLIPHLYAAGVFSLGMEFGAEEDQAALDALVTAEQYDEDLARRLMFNYNVGWAYREYMDLYRAAWRLNRSLDASARPFRILNLSYRYDWRDFGGVTTPAAMARVFHRGGTEAFRAGVIRREVLERGEKLLVLTGTIHAITRYAWPVYDYNTGGFIRLEDRHMGNLLYQDYPGRVCTILLHQPFDSLTDGGARLVYPAAGAIDAIMTGFDDRRVGFDLAGPLGDLRDASYYSTGRSDFRLRDLADGYVYERPFSDYEGCTIDRQFLNDNNWPEAQAQFPDRNWHKRPDSLAELWAKIEAYVDMDRRHSRLEPWPYADGELT